MKSEIITTWRGVDALGGEWNTLLRESDANTIFLTWEWISAWRRTIEDSVEPFVIAVRDDTGRLAGIGPFYFSRLCLANLVPYRCLRTLGDYPTGAEYPDWIVHRSCGEKVAESIARTLAARSADWDLMWLPLMCGWNASFERLEIACKSAGLSMQSRPTDFSAIPLPSTYPEYEKMLSKNVRDELKRSFRVVVGRSGAKFELCDRPERIPEYLEAMFDLNARRWASAGAVGTFVRKPLEARFYHEFSPTALEHDWLFLSALRIHDTIMAVDVGYIYDGRFYALQGGFDPGGPKNMGHVQRKFIVEKLIDRGIREFDFLGTVTDYKRRYGARERFGYQVLVGSPGWLTTPLLAAGFWPTGRYMQFRGLPS
ncbi:MAG: GNAT family N-acetyltransferase [Gammaproteobacteria bacterium]|nr:GNAT family N-acetyltransferase [Gammaproteobacteria bacterium]MDH5512729.1 GNAT family N-acetyltransferase [Gammaproteobacteria bacterium]